jgi:predicted acylesterase/phospholipase RssA
MSDRHAAGGSFGPGRGACIGRHLAEETAMIWRTLEKPVAFVLGGGGSLGAMQVGMLEALAEHAIVPDLVVGTSVGAINGAVLAADPQGAAHRLAHSWSRLDPSRVFPRSIIGPLRALRERHNHLVSESGLAKILNENLSGGATFDDLAVPLRVVTTDAATGEAVVISSGPLVPALLASAAIPGIFPPVERDGRFLYDGGLVANMPVRQAVQAGAKSLVLLDCTFPGHPPIAGNARTNNALRGDGRAAPANSRRPGHYPSGGDAAVSTRTVTEAGVATPLPSHAPVDRSCLCLRSGVSRFSHNRTGKCRRVDPITPPP